MPLDIRPSVNEIEVQNSKTQCSVTTELINVDLAPKEKHHCFNEHPMAGNTAEADPERRDGSAYVCRHDIYSVEWYEQ